ncbi:hypothetical protein ACROYT_G037181 [Oculina patagonica]
MGSPVSAVVANLYMESFEEQGITSTSYKPKIWKRYVDDTFTILDRGIVDSFLQHLNNQQPSIRFTMEAENGCKIAFLDTTVSREPDGRLTCTTSVYRKPTHTDQYLARSPRPESRAPVLSLRPSLNLLRFYPISKVFPNNLDAASIIKAIPCECGKVYIGETGRPMQDRIKEHDRDIRLARIQTSAVSEHTHNTGHYPLWNEVKFIDRESHWFTRRVKEVIQIRLHPNNINRDSGIEIPEAWMPTIKKHNTWRTERHRTPEGTPAHWNSEDRNAPIIVVENQPITVQQRAL